MQVNHFKNSTVAHQERLPVSAKDLTARANSSTGIGRDSLKQNMRFCLFPLALVQGLTLSISCVVVCVSLMSQLCKSSLIRCPRTSDQFMSAGCLSSKQIH